MMEAGIPMKQEASDRFAKPSTIAEALEKFQAPKQGPNVKAIYSEEAIKKLLAAMVKKDVRSALANLEVEAGGFSRATKRKSEWLASHLQEKKILRGDSEKDSPRFWTDSQLRNVMEAFGWVPQPSRRDGNAGRKPGKQRLSPEELRLRQYKIQLGLLDVEEEESSLDSLEALQAEFETESKAISSLREEIDNLDEEISACESRIREATEQKRRISDFVEKREKVLSELEEKIENLRNEQA